MIANQLPRWYRVDLNPVPWAVGPLGLSRKGGKMTPYVGPNAQLKAFQEAVRAQFTDTPELEPGTFKLKFYFWRQIEAYQSHQARHAKSHHADVTNMQKAMEDALQGVLYKNDKNTVWVESVMVEQNETCVGKVIFSITPMNPELVLSSLAGIPENLMYENLPEATDLDPNRNDWGSGEGLF